MAKALAPLHSSEARGRVGGIVYNSWRGTATVKAKHAPSQPRSSKQLTIRAALSMLSRYWGAVLDAADRATWTDYAAAHVETDWTGGTKRLTGLNWFLRLSARLSTLSVDPVHTAPIVVAPDTVVGFGLTPIAGQITVAWTDSAVATEKCSIWIDGPHSPGRISSEASIKWNSDVTMATATKVISGLQTGTYTIWVRALSATDGQVSAWVSASAVVPAA